MTSSSDNRFFLPAWGISLALHSVAVGLALAFVSQVKPVLQEDMFQWDVALVKEARLDSKSEPVKSAMASEQPSAKKALPPQIKPVSEVSQIVTPIERKVEIPQLRDEPVEQRMVEVAEPKAEPVVEAKEPEPVAVAATTEPVEAPPMQHEPVSAASKPLHEPSAELSSRAAAEDVAPVLVAKASASVPEAKLDHRWLAESLWRRVAELKRYPNFARMNGQEGKVILKAVIRSDGYLADVSVQKSSGYNVLDEAAIEAVKLACPLHMKYAIGKPQIVVSLPIVYSLAN
ncbi:MAG: energy transducer TonB [Nitrospirota bacterium]